MSRQINHHWKHQNQKCEEPRRGYSSLRSLTEPVNPVNIPARLAEEIRERQYDRSQKGLRKQSVGIVTEPVHHPDKKQRQADVK